MEIINCEQRSEEWYKVRCGIPTASEFDKIITTKGKASTQSKKYMYKLAGESITGKAEETYQSASMLRGCEVEEEARNYYEMIKNVELQKVGFCLADGCGCSPDAFSGYDGMVEIKCPIMSTHVGYLLKDTLSTDYFQQCQGQLFVADRKWCDLISYYPGLKPLIIRVERDEGFISDLEVELKMFCNELKEVINQIK